MYAVRYMGLHASPPLPGEGKNIDQCHFGEQVRKLNEKKQGKPNMWRKRKTKNEEINRRYELELKRQNNYKKDKNKGKKDAWEGNIALRPDGEKKHGGGGGFAPVSGPT